IATRMPLPVGLATWTLRLPLIGPVVTPILSVASMRESMSAMCNRSSYSERDWDSMCGTPTLPPPVLPGSGSTGRGLFRSQPVSARRLPGDGMVIGVRGDAVHGDPWTLRRGGHNCPSGSGHQGGARGGFCEILDAC